MQYAAQNGHIEVVKWARENGCLWDECACSYVASNGHLKVLKWARERMGVLGMKKLVQQLHLMETLTC